MSEVAWWFVNAAVIAACLLVVACVLFWAARIAAWVWGSWLEIGGELYRQYERGLEEGKTRGKTEQWKQYIEDDSRFELLLRQRRDKGKRTTPRPSIFGGTNP